MYQNMKKDQLIQELMSVKSKLDSQNKVILDMKSAFELAEKREKELYAIMKGAKAVLEEQSFAKSARVIFDLCKDLVGATSGYVALLNDTGEENEVLFLESGGLPCSVDPELPMPIRGLRAEAYYNNKAVYHNNFMKSQWVDFMPKGHVILENVMFAPLILNNKTVGIIGLANKENDFDENDAKMAAGFGELAAIALKNSYNLDQRLEAEKQREETIESLRDALAKVKRLSGLLPICSYCKKIRDDKGYWNEVEVYIHKHSDTVFSHGICRDCADKNFPEMGLYDD